MMADDRCDLLCLDLPRAEAIRTRLDVAAAGRAAVTAKALGDPTRLTIAMALREGEELCVCVTWDGSRCALRTSWAITCGLCAQRAWPIRVATGRSCSTR